MGLYDGMSPQEIEALKSAEALNLFLEAIALALREMEREKQVPAAPLLDLIREHIHESQTRMRGDASEDLPDLILGQLGLLATLQSFVESGPLFYLR